MAHAGGTAGKSPLTRFTARLAAVWLAAIMLPIPCGAARAASALSESSEACVECHRTVTPGIVADWEGGVHAKTTLGAALGRPAGTRRMSSLDIPSELRDAVVGCFECHGRNPQGHPDTFEHFGKSIHVVVTPADCGTCHGAEVAQYGGSKKAHAVGNLRDNPTYHALVTALTSTRSVAGHQVKHGASSEGARATSCFACHGTEVKVKGTKTVSSSVGDVIVPVLEGWPNVGVGRINPDGTRGACTSCHPRHGFSIEIARKPHTCSQCHLNPDTPAWEVWAESKHGNITLSDGHGWDWRAVPWVPGRDFRAPSCAACHMAGLAAADGSEIAARSHDFGSRLWVRIFGLIYSHPQPRSGRTAGIRNEDGTGLPTSFAGRPASEFLIDAGEQLRRKERMRSVCRACHSSSWADGHFARMDSAVAEADTMVRAATVLMQSVWKAGKASPANPFDEEPEYAWMRQWLFYANSVRYAAAMGGPDYAGFKNGWFAMNENLEKLRKAAGFGIKR
ncbi:MAG: multiheme c-type cytochrome [Candidatus Coatesbacteria bacterium]